MRNESVQHKEITVETLVTKHLWIDDILQKQTKQESESQYCRLTGIFLKINKKVIYQIWDPSEILKIATIRELMIEHPR